MTNETIRCPECQSENVVLSKKRKVHFCEDCQHEFTAAQPIAPLRIFLSYGHDNNEELVRRIKADLEKRGHDVWFDKSEIKFGDDWRRSITEGISNSHKFVSFLSKHSTRDPGVCRDEIAIAIGVKGGNIQTILVESEQEVQPPVNIGHIQWLDMHDWKERRAADETAWEKWYQEKLEEIIAVVESDESRRFAGEIEELNGHLKPIKSEARICQLLGKGFYGREWLFEAVEQWRTTQTPSPLGGERAGVRGESRLFWIMGAPGVGKSAFAAQLTHTRGDTVIAAQFCEWDKPDHRNAARVVRSLAFQLATRLPDYRKLLLTLPEIAELDRKDAAELFDYLLANPLRLVIKGGRERYLIVIDALDEAGEAGRNPLVEMLARNAQRLPNWIGIVVTSRPEFDVKNPLQALNPFPLDTQSESNRADIRDYLRRELASHLQKRPDADRLVEQILEKSEGVFLYVERFCEDVQHGHLSLDRPEQFPQGLGGIFAQYFQRQFPDLEKYEKTIEPALGAILAAREPLPVEILQDLFGWRETQLRKWLRTFGSLFPVTTEADSEVIKTYHKSLADWLADEAKAGKYFVSVLEGHRMLAEHFNYVKRTGNSWRDAPRRCLSELPYHLCSAGDGAGVVQTLCDLRFADAKCGEGMVHELVHDYQRALGVGEVLRAGQARVEEFGRFISSSLHVLSRFPELLFQTAHNWAQSGEVVGEARCRATEGFEGTLIERLNPPELPRKGPLLRRIVSHSDRIGALTLLSGAHRAVSVGDCQINVWELDSGSCEATFDVRPAPYADGVLMRDGRHLVYSAIGQSLAVFDVEAGQVVRTIGLPFSSIGLCLGAGPSADTVLVGLPDEYGGAVALWDWQKDECRLILEGLSEKAECVVAIADPSMALAADRKGTLCVWDLCSGDLVHRLTRLPAPPVRTAAVPGTTQVLCGQNAGVASLWNVPRGDCVRVYPDRPYFASAVAVDPEGRWGLLGGLDGVVRVWDLAAARCVGVATHGAAITSAAVTFDGRLAVTAGADHCLCVWDMESLTAGSELASAPARVLDLCRGCEGYLAVRHRDGDEHVIVRQVDGEAEWSVSVFQRIWCAAFGGEGRFLATRSGRRVHVHELREDGYALKRPADSADRWASVPELEVPPAGQVILSQDGRLLVSGGSMFVSTVMVWDVDEGKCVRELRGHYENDERADVTRCMVASADFTRLASGGGLFDTSVRIWDLGNGDCVRRIPPTGNLAGSRIAALAGTPQLDRLLAANDGGHLWILDGLSGEVLGEWNGAGCEIVAVGLRRDGKLGASLSAEGVVDVWQLPSGIRIGRYPMATEGSAVLLVTDSDVLAAETTGEVHILRVHRGTQLR